MLIIKALLLKTSLYVNILKIYVFKYLSTSFNVCMCLIICILFYRDVMHKNQIFMIMMKSKILLLYFICLMFQNNN